MRASLILALVLTVALPCFGQEGSFTEKFTHDSLGENGFRQKSVVIDTAKGITFVNGQNLIGYSDCDIIKLLGAPNSIDTTGEDTVLFTYFISPTIPLEMSRNAKKTPCLLITISGKKGIAVDMVDLIEQETEKDIQY